MFQRETRLLVLLTLLAATSLFSQNLPLSINLSTVPHREPLNVFPGQTMLRVCGLTPGSTYQLIATAAYPGQEAAFQLALADPAQEQVARPQSPADRPHLRRFKAEGSCGEFLLDAQGATEQYTEIPMYLSVGCLDCPETINKQLDLSRNLADAANLVTTQGQSATDLVTNVLIGGNCFDVSNIKSSGASASRGTFSQGTSSINISNGIVLCTGPTNVLPGPNLMTNANGGFGTNSPDDPNLAALTTGNQYDVSIIEFDFKPTANMVQFDFVFGSEEYCEYVNSIYNDVFGFFISGPGITGVKNLAVLPDGVTPVAINNVNHLKNQAYYRNNNAYATCAGQPTVTMTDIELDGFTTVLTATANVIPCSTYHIKLAIADVGDANYLSAVFLRANSFSAGGKVLAEAKYPSPSAGYTRENCDESYIRFYRGTGDASQPLTVNYTLDPNSTATPGLDFEPLPSSITIPAGQTEVLVPVKVINDQLTEGMEWFKLMIDNSCSCDQQDVTFVIEDNVPLVLAMPNQTGCAGSATLTPVPSGGLPPLIYQWNTGQTTPSVTQTAFGSAVYTVTVTDACGLTAVSSAIATVDVSPTAILGGTAEFCAGGSGPLQIAFTGNGPWIVGLNANGTPLTQTFTTNPATLTVNQPGTYGLTSVLSQAGCPGLVGGTGTAQAYSVSVSLTPTHPLCFGGRGTILANAVSNATGLIYSWSTGAAQPFIANQPAGVYLVTVTTPQGCTSTAAAALVEPPQLISMIQDVVNINCYVPVGSADLSAQGGTPPYQYAWSTGSQQTQGAFTSGGTYTATVTDANGCTAVASAAVAQNTTPPTVAASANDEITCNTPQVVLSSAGSSVGPNFIYNWSTQNGSIVSDMEQPTALVDAPGQYTLLITNTTNGCTAAAQALVAENTNYPTALNLQIVQPGCNNKPGSVQVQGVTGGEGPFVFSINDGRDFMTQDGFGDLKPGSYSIVVQDANGCEYEQSFLLVPPMEPDVQIVPEVSIAFGETAQLILQLNVPAGEMQSILWSPPAGITPTSRPDVFDARPFSNTLYTVTVISKEGCHDEAQVLIRVGKPDIYAPNVFRPSSPDGFNSQFMLFSRDNAVNAISRLQVFDRWGNLVFGRDNIAPNDSRSGGWDGRYKGKLLEPGVFTWWADIELASGEHIQLKGDVTLVD